MSQDYLKPIANGHHTSSQEGLIHELGSGEPASEPHINSHFDDGDIIDPFATHDQGYELNNISNHASGTQVALADGDAVRNRQLHLSRSATKELVIPSRPLAASSELALKRALYWRHIFMISIGAVIGMGYYVRTGTIHRVGGSSAVLYAYGFLGLLSFMVMHPLATMLRIWPVRTPLMSFVTSFVNEEIGVLVGILYWLTYCFSYAALTTAIGELFESLNTPVGVQGFFTFLSLALPLLCNLMDIRYLRRVELICGTLKLTIALGIILMINSINASASNKKFDHCETKEDKLFVAEGPAKWFGNIWASMFLASFSFLGIEVVAATAPEASLMKKEVAKRMENRTTGNTTGSAVQTPSHPPSEFELDDPFKAPAILVPLTATIVYTWGGWIVTQNLASCDTRLPSLAWNAPRAPKTDTGSTSTIDSNSIFVLSAANETSGAAIAVTAFLILNLISTSSTALFVASRSLFGLATRLSSTPQNGEPETIFENLKEIFKRPRWLLDIAARFLARKNQFDVPYAAVWGSCWLFWVPTLRYRSPIWASAPSDIAMELGSVCCILVWACESFAAFRLYRHFHKFPLAGEGSIQERLPTPQNSLNYLFYRNVSLFSSIFCLLIIFLGGTFTFIHDKNPVHAVSAYLMPFLFALWAGIGYFLRWRKDKKAKLFKDLSTQANLRSSIQRLDKMREEDLRSFVPEKVKWYNIWGILFSKRMKQMFGPDD